MGSWFNSCASTGQENATVQNHKSAGFSEEAKVAVGTEFFNKMYYSLATIINHSGDLMLVFSCKWSEIVQAFDEALGPKATVKRLNHYVRWHLSGRYIQQN